MLNRRRVLKSTGALAGSGILTTHAVSAQHSQNEEWVGITYDEVTHQIQDTATAHVVDTGDGIKGTLDFAGFRVPFGQRTPVERSGSSTRPRYRFEKTEQQFRSNGQPLVVDVDWMNECIVGTATRESGKFGNLGITLVPKSTVEDPIQLRQGLTERGTGVTPPGFDSPPTISNTGIPTKTSMDYLAKESDR